MVHLQAKPLTNTWVSAPWDVYLRLIEDPAYVKAKGYYFNDQMRIETVGVGPDHARENTILILAIGLYCGFLGLSVKGLTNASYRKPGVKEAQPDISYYVGERVAIAPQGSAITNLDETPPPDLVIEIADSSLNDDLGKKRLLYEDLGVSEYWVVDVEALDIIAFQMVDRGSRRITQSEVLPGLELAVLIDALKQSRQADDSQVVAGLMTQFNR